MDDTGDGSTLHDRLDALGHKIASVRAQMTQRDTLFHPHHTLTGKEIEIRYQVLRQQVARDVADEESHGHHVGNLEKSVREWLLDFDV